MTSHSKIIFKAPFNDLSFGQVSYNLAKAMYRSNINVSIFPIGESINLSAYDKIDPSFFEWLKKSIENRYNDIDINTKTLQLWHIRGSDSRPTSNSNLFTFHEISGVTDTEKSVCSLHNNVIFSSSFSKKIFDKAGVKNCSFSNIGFDEEIEKNNKTYFKDIIHFVLIGKWESRKNTEKIIKTWLSIFGNKKDYRLTCLVENPFISPESMSSLIGNCFDGKDYFNITFLPRLKTNSEMVDLYNSCDIDLSGLSSAEGWNLPSFNATCLGKWSCVANNTAHTDWANKENCILVNSLKEKEPYDNVFFRKGDYYNQGEIYEVSEESIRDALSRSLSFAKKPNLEGEKLKEIFTYDNCLKNILSII
jgi:hypothetical protein